jgi:hypothetical protein
MTAVINGNSLLKNLPVCDGNQGRGCQIQLRYKKTVTAQENVRLRHHASYTVGIVCHRGLKWGSIYFPS